MKSSLGVIVFYIVLGLLVTGCASDLSQTIDETDTKVYDIIDSAWENDVGSKENYKIKGQASNSIENKLAVPESGFVTLPMAVAVATANNYQYSIEKDKLYLIALDQVDIQHLYEPMFFGGGISGYRKDSGNEGKGVFGDFGVEQLLATGAHISSNITIGWLDIITGDMRSGLSTIATAVITQPLLRGADRRVVIENLTQAQQNTLYQVRSFNRFRKDFVTSVISDYYFALELNERQINASRYYSGLEDMYANLLKLSAAGKLPQHELEQADQDRHEAFSDYEQARTDHESFMDAFKIQLSIAPDTKIKLDMNELDILGESISETMTLSEEQAIEIALNQRLDLANSADKVVDASRKVDVAADAIRAELSLVGYAHPRLRKGSFFGADPGDLRRTRDRYELSIQLDLGVDRLAEKNAYRRALISLMQLQRMHQEHTDNIILQVRKAYRQMQEAFDLYGIKSQSCQVAKKRAENTLLLLKYNRASTRDVLDAHKDLLRAQNDITKALTDYAAASLEFYRDTGIMKIKPDGMWEKAVPIVKAK